MLLGIESRDHSDNEAEDQGVIAQERDLPRLKSDYDLLKTVHADISELRQVLTDKYAESFTENCKIQWNKVLVCILYKAWSEQKI